MSHVRAELNWTPDRRHQQQCNRVAHIASQPGIGVVKPTATVTAKLFGRGVVPKFFWGGKAARAVVVVSSDQRLILMGVWRDPSQPHEKKPARFEPAVARNEERFKLAADAAKKKIDVLLTTAG